MTADDAKNKIRKLLALAGSDNDNEAQSALLAARRLMARYKLCEKDVSNKKPELKRVLYEEDTFSGIRNSWFYILAKVIAEHHCCSSFQNGAVKSQVKRIGFAGLDDDPTIAKMMFTYAHDHIVNWGIETACDFSHGNPSRKLIKELTFNYAMGFSDGLQEQYRKQNRQCEPGMELMIVKPIEVSEWESKLRKESLRRGEHEYHPFAMECGYKDGYTFTPTRRLHEQEG